MPGQPERVVVDGPGVIARDDEHWMGEALIEAERAAAAGEVPVGAVVLHGGRIIGRGHNRTEALQDPTAHAEIIAITAAANGLGSWRLEETTLYVTLEPCVMCLGAIFNARIPRLVFATHDPKRGAAGSVLDLTENERLNHHLEMSHGVCRQEASDMLSRFFAQLRRESRG